MDLTLGFRVVQAVSRNTSRTRSSRTFMVQRLGQQADPPWACAGLGGTWFCEEAKRRSTVEAVAEILPLGSTLTESFKLCHKRPETVCCAGEN